MTKLQFLIKDPQELNIRFYKLFDHSFLLNKAETLLFIAENSEKYKKFVVENGGAETGIDDKYLESLRAEVHFTEFHQFEGFFALLIAIYQELPHWLYLTTYETKVIKEKVDALIEGDIKAITNGKLDTMDEFLNWSIYSSFISTEPSKVEKWQLNLDNIAWMLIRMAKKYMEAKEYNAYKHGLRVHTGHTFIRFHPTDNPAGEFGYESGDSLIFLETEKINSSTKLFLVREIYKHFNPIESINHIAFMSAILETIRTTRLARFQNETDARLNVFINLDRDELVTLRTVTQWKVTL